PSIRGLPQMTARMKVTPPRVRAKGMAVSTVNSFSFRPDQSSHNFVHMHGPRTLYQDHVAGRHRLAQQGDGFISGAGDVDLPGRHARAERFGGNDPAAL